MQEKQIINFDQLLRDVEEKEKALKSGTVKETPLTTYMVQQTLEKVRTFIFAMNETLKAKFCRKRRKARELRCNGNGAQYVFCQTTSLNVCGRTHFVLQQRPELQEKPTIKAEHLLKRDGAKDKKKMLKNGIEKGKETQPPPPPTTKATTTNQQTSEKVRFCLKRSVQHVCFAAGEREEESCCAG